MADRASVAIRIGGSLSPDLLPGFCAAVASDGVFTDWEGTAFDSADLDTSAPLYLADHEVAWGRFEAIETFCVDHALSLPAGLAALLGRSARSGWSLTARPFGVSAPRTMTRS